MTFPLVTILGMVVDWPLALTIITVVGILAGSLIRIFGGRSKNGRDNGRRGSGSGSSSRSDVHDIDKRVAVLEEQVETLRREMGRMDKKVSKLSELMIEWVQSGKRSR